MAVPAKLPGRQHPSRRKRAISPTERVILQLYQRGLKRSVVAEIMRERIVPPEEAEQKGWDLSWTKKVARRRLKQMEETQWFRDELWRMVTIKTDLASGKIMDGIVEKAERGDVPAAKFALGVAGRYTEHAESQPTTVHVNFGFLPRPERHTRAQETLEAEDAEFEVIESQPEAEEVDP